VKDLEASRRLYEALGMEVFDEVEGLRVVLKSGHSRLALTTFLEESSLSFRGADVFALHAAVIEAIPQVDGAPQRRPPGHVHGVGESWLTRDPDRDSITSMLGLRE
jgi:hypothetical protein